VVTSYLKRRDPAPPGSIPDRLRMFVLEVRFYREVAPSLGVRVPGCLRAEEHEDGSTLLELEDLSEWRPGADAASGAELLSGLHSRWEGTAVERWPWLPRQDVSELVDDLFAASWPTIRERRDMTPQARALGDRVVGRVKEAERRAEISGPWTLVHGDASYNNMRTSPTGEVALLDWEDFGAGPGVCDLAWFLVSSVDPKDWDSAIGSYKEAAGLDRALPAAAVQGLLSLAAEDEGTTPDAAGWTARVAEAGRRS
jgi:hypothetical protein